MTCCPDVGWECVGNSCVITTTTTSTTTIDPNIDCCGGYGIALEEGGRPVFTAGDCENLSLCPPNAWSASTCIKDGQAYCCCATYGQANCTPTGCQELPPGVQGEYETVFDCYTARSCIIDVWACFIPAYNCAMYRIVDQDMQPNEYFTEAECDANCIPPPIE